MTKTKLAKQIEVVGPNYRAIKKDLEEHDGIQVTKIDNIAAAFIAPRGVFLEDIFIEELNSRVRVIRFSRKENDYLIPALYHYKAELGEGFQILLFPICWIKLRRETRDGPPNFLQILCNFN